MKNAFETVSGIGLEFFPSLESRFPGALQLQSTVELVLQYLSHGVLHHRKTIIPLLVGRCLSTCHTMQW